MAFNKSKALEEAARLVSQRKLPQAIKQYLAVIEQDPQDLPLRNIVGDLWVREGNPREAIREFNILAEAYTREGFILKAIAIYKKVVKLDSDSPDALLRLAELYAGQKFTHEANEQYAQALAICERRSLNTEAGRILRTLTLREPENPHYQMRLGDFLAKSGQSQDACRAFVAAAQTFQQNKNASAASTALSKAASIEPENTHIALFQARVAAGSGNFAEVERIFNAVLPLRSDPDAQPVLLGALLEGGKFKDAADLAREAFRANSGGRAALQQFSTHSLGAPAPEALHSLAELLCSVAEFILERNEWATEGAALLAIMQKALAARPSDVEVLRRAAELCERAGVGRAPDSLIELIGSGFNENGDWRKAEQAFRELTGRNPGNVAWRAGLEQALRQQSLDLPPEQVQIPATAPPHDSPASGGTQEAAVDSAAAIEVDFSAEWDAFAAQDAAASHEVALPVDAQPGAHEAFENAPANEPTGPVQEAEAAGSAALPDEPPWTAREEPESRDRKPATDRAMELGAQVSQARFYLDSGFLAEAGAILIDLAEKLPGDAEVRALQARLDGANSAPTGTADELPEDSAPFSAFKDPESVLAATDFVEPAISGIEGRIETEDLTPTLPAAEMGTQAGSLLGDLAQELELAFDEPESASGSEAPRKIANASLFDSTLEELLTELEPTGTSTPADDTPQTHYNLGVAFREMGLLDEAIGEFQKVVKGRIPQDHPPRFLEASSMLGNCFMEKHMPEIAARWYRRALQAPGIDEEIALALTYDLATACELSGNLQEAQEKFSEVYSLNIDYRDVAEKVQSLSRSRPA